MWFGILGPLLVNDGAIVVRVPAARQRALLAVLVLNAGRVVPADELTEAVWDGSPPTSSATLRTHVMRLRRALGPQAGERVVTRSPGYLLDAAEHEVDALLFTRLCREGGAAVRTRTWPEASAKLVEALSLWRGTALADISAPAVRRAECPRLEQLRVQAIEWRADAMLHLGCHDELLPELQLLVTGHPLRERLHALLMLALYRCGRPAEALAAYEHAREVLADTLGADPGPQLRELHQQILVNDPRLAVDHIESHAAGPVAGVPRQLPAQVRHFVGRAQELAELTGLLELVTDETESAPVVISAVGGTAGVGKTALVLHWAHRVAARFPDGQLYVNLHGYDPGQPMSASYALAGFLRSLGVAGQDVPAEVDERAAMYRSLLAGRRLLVVLDNALSAEQVRPLLPGAAGCIAVVTSRDALAGLAARDGARRLDLDLLPLPDAVSLLRALLGRRVDAEPGAAEALALHSARLPLALRVAAELAAARPGISLAELADELADRQRRLDLLDSDQDRTASVRTVFSWSYGNLEPDAAHLFGLLGLHPGADFDVYAAAALAGSTVPLAQSLLDHLGRAYLIRPTGLGRYGMHDLLRDYAAEQTKDDADRRRTAMARLLDYYLHTAVGAISTLFPAERQRLPHTEPPPVPSPPVTGDSATARTWLDTERASLVRLVAYAAENRWPWHATRLAATLSRYLDVAGHYADATAIHRHARTAASRARDPAAEANALTELGNVDWRQGRHERAADRFRLAVALSRQTADHACEARALTSLGLVDLRQGRHQQAAAHLRQGLVLCRRTGDLPGQARALGNLGVVGLRQGRYRQAAGHLRQALAIHRQTGNQTGEANALGNLGDIALRLGSYHEAAEYFQRALDMHHQIGNPTIGAYALTNLGIVAQHQGRLQQATGYHEQALSLFRQTGDRSGEAGALNGLGEVLLAAGRPDHARTQHTIALDLAAQIGEVEKQARAHLGLARACNATDDPDLARHHWHQALTLYTSLGAPEADQIRAQLATTADRDHHADRDVDQERPPPGQEVGQDTAEQGADDERDGQRGPVQPQRPYPDSRTPV
jgi:DNA-binding SARP family transcriptional activator/Tfp pilus assembly protein PilF